MKKTLTTIIATLFISQLSLAEDAVYTVDSNTDTTGKIYVGGTLVADQSVSYNNVTVNVTGGKILTNTSSWSDGLYGAANEFGNSATSYTANKITINMSAGDVHNIIAGGFLGNESTSNIGATEINISGGTVQNAVLGANILTYDSTTSVGKSQTYVGSSKIVINGNAIIGSTVTSAYDKSNNNDVIFNSVYGGGYTAGYGNQKIGSTNVSIAGNAIVNGIVVGGSHAGPTANAYVGDKTATNFSKVVSEVSIGENADVKGGFVFGGAYNSWGSGNTSSDIYGSTLVKISGGKIYNSDMGTGFVFGGGYSSDGLKVAPSKSNVYGGTTVEISGGEVANVFGGMYVNEAFGYGSAQGSIHGDTNVNITGGKVINVYGGSLTERVTGAGGLTISTSVMGNTNIVISDTIIEGNVFGGGKGSNSIIEGNSNIVIKGNAQVLGIISGDGESLAMTADNENISMVKGEKNLTVENFTSTNALNVSNFDNLAINNSENVKLEGTLNLSNLAIDNNSSVSLSEGSTIDNYTLIFAEDFQEGSALDLNNFSDIKIGEETIVMSQLAAQENANFSVKNSSGNEFELLYDKDKGTFSAGVAIPEPSTYAIIIGVIATAFVAYRRRK